MRASTAGDLAPRSSQPEELQASETDETLVVNMDGDETKGAMVNEDEQRGFETVVEELLLPVASGGRLAMFKTKLGLLANDGSKRDGPKAASEGVGNKGSEERGVRSETRSELFVREL
ncbi:hypothetical protein F2Q69_00061434 [Brassica cretica]|uniref:Uncharacterized protein n=1 Tax=Brassica cretica TaxID=69181 RepID=A0A8S9RJQ5_BRACR|nr:hypothetical protein F2Q69_00061434 [Brassica cretica]